MAANTVDTGYEAGTEEGKGWFGEPGQTGLSVRRSFQVWVG